MMEQLYGITFGIAMGVLILFMFLVLIRAIKGPEITDRIVASNMLGTLTIMAICLLAFRLDKSYLLDVALIYAMISFLAVVVLTKVYMGVHKEHLAAHKKSAEEAPEGEDGAVNKKLAEAPVMKDTKEEA